MIKETGMFSEPHTEPGGHLQRVGALWGRRAGAGCRCLPGLTPETFLRQLSHSPTSGPWRCPMPTSAVPTASAPATSRALGSGRQRTRRPRRGPWTFWPEEPRTTVSDVGPGWGGRGWGASYRGGLGDPERDPQGGPLVTWRTWTVYLISPRPSRGAWEKVKMVTVTE